MRGSGRGQSVASRDERRPGRLGPKRCAGGDHRRAASVDGLDDFGVVDSLEIDRRDAEVAVAELPLNDHERHALESHFDGMRVSQLVRGEPSADTCCNGGAPQLSSSGGGRPLTTTRSAVEDTEQRANWKLDAQFEPWQELVPSPRVHADFATTSAFAATYEQRAAWVVEIGFRERSASWMRKSARQRTTIKPRSRRPCASSPDVRMTATSPQPLADRRDTGDPCCAAVDQHGSRAWLLAIDVDQRGQAAARTWPLPGPGERTKRPPMSTCAGSI